jgi:hypothetical protein
MSIASMIAKAGQTLTHQRQDAAAVTGSGARKAGAWTTLASGIPCWVQPASADVTARAAAQQMLVTHEVYLLSDLSARANDRLLIGSTYYLVHGVTDRAGLGRVWRLDVEELR